MSKKKKRPAIIPKNKIINNLRQLHFQGYGYKEAKADAKVDKSTYQCQNCGDLYYRGTSDKVYEELVEKYSPLEIKKGKLQIDHINPVVDIKRGFQNYDEYIVRLFCSPDDLRAICKPCHSEITREQNKQRKLHAKANAKI